MSRLDFTDPAVLDALAAALTAAGVDGIEITQSSRTLRLVVAGEPPRATVHRDASPAAAAAADIVAAPMAGLLDLRTVPSDLPRTVRAGEILACLRVGPVLVPVRAMKACTVMRCLCDADALVGFGDPLFDIKARP
ncbi:acetyl-CoA carboxylase [Rhizobium sp. DKSPLA3]|uniref:Acetyl-CoA carboxylase n=1 Tax=Rhizobium quercicola TaxID=2901226 RepID=A0A9X1NQQ6_9HYPH|nr:acetyl-CoA carboxylase [Rhizobium quercicola]MCD7109447.1 acetyl-CoA carboxylase [Rhizobium quercicola]